MRRIALALVAGLSLMVGSGIAAADHGGGHGGSAPGVHDNPVVNPGAACTTGNEASGGVSGAAIGGNPGTGNGSVGNEMCEQPGGGG